MTEIRAWAAHGAKQQLEAFAYDPGALGSEEVEIKVEHCGVCHSDLSILNDDWGFSKYPVVPGHEVIGRIVAVGERVQGLQVGQRVGVGWNSGCCMHCAQCISGHQNMCNTLLPTIVGHFGGFADRLRAHWIWAIPLPESLDATAAGPLLCGGTTVFGPLLELGIKPTDRVGVVGIGGLGHLAVKFAKAWGCEVTAFTSSDSKVEEAKRFGAHRVVSSLDGTAIRNVSSSLDLLLVTVNVPLDWKLLLRTLKPYGRLHILGLVLEPLPIAAMELIFQQKAISGSPTSSPSTIATMLDFAARHQITPQVEHFPMSKVNEALEHLRAGKARYRIVLDADFT